MASRKLKRVNHKLELSEYKVCTSSLINGYIGLFSKTYLLILLPQARLKRKCNSKSSNFGFSNAVKRVSDKVSEKLRRST